MNKPELVMPAGDLEKLQTALLFGADAVYAGGKEFSLRAHAGNLTLQEINEGLIFAHALGKKIYVTVNILAHNRDLKGLPPYLESLQELGVDGLIISDPGVLGMARRYAPQIPITISTQANVSNYESASFYKDLGAKRIVLARELTLEEIIEIKKRTGIEVEMFVHGAMCVSYSGRCLLSYYMTGRNANEGACAHPCRYRYQLQEEKRPGEYFPIEEDERGSYILNSRDLCLLQHLPRLIEAGIDAFKIEGRMKSPLYVAVVGQVYRQAIDTYMARPGEFIDEQLQLWESELRRIATRPYTDGFIDGPDPGLQDIDHQTKGERDYFCGVVKGYNQEYNCIVIEQRANFGPGDELELLIPGGSVIPLKFDRLYDEKMQEVDRARHPRQLIYLPWDYPVAEFSILRRRGI